MARTRATQAASSVNEDGSQSGAKGSMESVAEATESVRKPVLSERTDYTRWRLLDERGRQTWHYLEDDEDAKEWPQSTADKYFLGLPTV
jgi:lanosterol synthase